MSEPSAAMAKLLIKTGVASLSLFVGLVGLLSVLHQIGLINAWQFPLKPVGAFLGGGGLACLLVGWAAGSQRKKRMAQVALSAFLGINALAYIGAYTLTHYSSAKTFRFGLPRPENSQFPTDVGLAYLRQRLPLKQTEWLEAWFIPAGSSSSQGTILLFPGNGGSKGKQLLAPAQVFHALNYDSLLLDFRGVGGSSGHTTTLGVREAKDVALALSYAQRLKLKRPFVLYGVSLGSAAILRALAQEEIQPDAIILELPFARLLSSVKSRLRARKLPSFPTAELLVFWGSVQHGFNGFAHNPVDYAKQVKCPTLVLQGQQDRWTELSEIYELVHNLRGAKQLVIFPQAGHQLLVTVNRKYWQQTVGQFLKEVERNRH